MTNITVCLAYTFCRNMFNTTKFLYILGCHRKTESVLMGLKGLPMPTILYKLKPATLRGLTSFYLLLRVPKNILPGNVTVVLQGGAVLRNCGRVCHVHRRQTGVSTQFNYYIHGLPPSKIVPRNCRFITNSPYTSVLA